jgi:mRNA-degrading endonuclease YafQ of YafQ-DinJ toxin-antitoxin module
MLAVVDGSQIRAWSVEKSELFDDSFRRMQVIFTDLEEKLEKFIKAKVADPIYSKYGKHDRRMVGHLAGFHHCHLRDDAVLIYSLNQRTITLVCVTPHAEIEGKRLKMMARRLSAFAA